jgi:type I restriction enzyme S subunit
MSAKRAKAGYKLTPCGEIPQDWECVPLGDIFAERVETGFNDLQLLAVTGDRGVVPRDSLNRRDSSNEDKSAYLRVLPGDIAYNTMRMWQGVAGLSEHEGIVSPAYTVCRPLKGLVPSFAPHLLKHPANIRLFHRHSQGLVDDTLNLKFHHFEKIQVVLPPTKEQKLIASVLADADTALIRGYTALEQHRSVRNSAVLAQIQALRSSRITCGKFITRIDAGKSPQCLSRPAEAGETGVLKIGAVTADGFDPAENKVVSDPTIFDASMKVRLGDFLMTRANGSPDLIGLSCVVDKLPLALFLSDKTFRISFDETKADKDYLSLCMKSKLVRMQIESASTGGSGSMSNLSQSAIRELRVPLPSLSEQKKIASLAHGMAAAIAAEEEKLASLELVKTELSRRLLTGELRVKP